MKRRVVNLLFLMSAVVALAAEDAPPADLLANLDFFQNLDMVQDKTFLAQNNSDKPETDSDEIDASTATVAQPEEKTNVPKP